MTVGSRVPLAWRSITHDKKRFALSLAGITFAVVLMFTQLGFLNAVFDSQIELLRRLDADLIVVNRSKHHLGILEPFDRRRLEQARSVAGVEAVCPIYIEGSRALWRNPDSGQLRLIRVIGIDPDQLAMLDASLARFAEALHAQDAVIVDARSKSFFGPLHAGTRTELAGRAIRVVGQFSRGTDFDFDGTVVMSASKFLQLFPAPTTAAGPGRVELGLVRVAAGADRAAVRTALERVLRDDVRVWTRAEFIAQEIHFWQEFTPIGFIFGLGLVLGFVVGVVICSQILFTGVVDRMPLFGTLKAIGYTNGYLMRLVSSEAVLLSMVSFLPGTLMAWLLYGVLSSLVGFDMFLNAERILLILSLTVAMSLLAALVALRKALRADPAEVFG